MTMPNQDPQAWRRRVDQKLNFLSKGHEDLNARLDKYELEMGENTKITKRIDTKIDDLITATAVAVDIAAKARWTGKAVRFFWTFSQKMAIWVGQFGVAAVTIFTLYYVFKIGGSWTKSFINIFNGNLP